MDALLFSQFVTDCISSKISGLNREGKKFFFSVWGHHFSACVSFVSTFKKERSSEMDYSDINVCNFRTSCLFLLIILF